MRIEQKRRHKTETIFDKTKPFSKIVSNFQACVYAVSGHGKTLCEEKIIEKTHNRGYVVVSLTEKFRHRLELAFANFKPTYKYHLNYLKEQGIIPDNKKVKIFAPFSFNENRYWTKKIFPVQFITFPIKKITPEIWAVIFETSTKSQVITAIVSAQKELLKSEGLTDLVRIATEKIRNNEVAGSEKTIRDIKTFLEPFKQSYFLASEECEYNFNPDDVIFNQEAYNIFHYGFLPDGFTKQEYVAINLVQESLLKRYEELKKDIKYSKKLKPLLLVIQEVMVFLPQNTDEVYVEKSAQIFEKNLLQVRSLNISSIGDSQKVFQTSERYRDSMTDEYYGRLSTPDIERLGKIARYTVQERNRLEGMPKGHYFKKGDREERVFLFPCHAHCEEGEDYHVKFAETYPDLLQDHKEVYEYMKETYKQEKLRHKLYLEEKKRKKQQKDMQKEMKEMSKSDSTKVEKAKLEVKLKQKQEELDKQLYINIFKDSKLNNNKISWVKLGQKYNIADKTAKAYAKKGQSLVRQATP